jgi:two-component system, NarL family, response regulator NreC
LADDHALMRRSLRLLLEGQEGVEVIAEADDLSSAVRHVHGHRPHVLVLDLRMPGGSSIEAIGRLRERAPDTQVVVLTMEEKPVFAQQALACGRGANIAWWANSPDCAPGGYGLCGRSASTGRPCP